MSRCTHPPERLVDHDGASVCTSCGEIVEARQPRLDEPDPAEVVAERRQRVKELLAPARAALANARTRSTRPKEPST